MQDVVGPSMRLHSGRHAGWIQCLLFRAFLGLACMGEWTTLTMKRGSPGGTIKTFILTAVCPVFAAMTDQKLLYAQG